MPIKPCRLKDGDVIGIVAPSSPFKLHDLKQGVAVLHAMGYRTHLADDLLARNGYLAGDDRQRYLQLHQMFADPQVNAVMCARGGFGAMKLLERLDYGLIGANAKPFIGFSDITALHQAFFQKTGLVTFHGPLVTTLAKADAAIHKTWKAALAGDHALRYAVHEKQILRAGSAEGIFRGGNLATLCHLLGTAFAPDLDGCLLFIEDTGEAPYRVDRMLTQMKMAGTFQGLKGLVVGSFKGCGDYAQILQLIDQHFKDMRIPVITGFPMGHDEPNVIVPLGLSARMDTDKGELVFAEAATRDCQ